MILIESFGCCKIVNNLAIVKSLLVFFNILIVFYLLKLLRSCHKCLQSKNIYNTQVFDNSIILNAN